MASIARRVLRKTLIDTNAPPELILYSTTGCHLCEQAAQMVWRQGSHHGRRLREVDVVDDEAVYRDYGIRIPVLKRCDSGAELAWPFSDQALTRFLA